MVVQNVQFNVIIYDYFIYFCFIQFFYEDVFYYFEKMKVGGFKFGYVVYVFFVKKCVKMGDLRWRLVVDEMKDVGYKIEVEL